MGAQKDLPSRKKGPVPSMAGQNAPLCEDPEGRTEHE